MEMILITGIMGETRRRRDYVPKALVRFRCCNFVQQFTFVRRWDRTPHLDVGGPAPKAGLCAEGTPQLNLNGICISCGARPDPQNPNECFCTLGLARARMREGANKKKRGL